LAEFDSYLDEKHYDKLLRHLGSDMGARQRFVGDFLSMWEGRVDRLDAAIDLPVLEDADVVLLSIRSSSVMVGALRLEGVGGLLHAAIKRGDRAEARKHLPLLREVGAVTCDRLRAVLSEELARSGAAVPAQRGLTAI
jgi:hypothetical protein